MRTLFGVNILVKATINVIKYKHNCDVKIDVQRNLMLCSVTSHNIRSHNMRDCVSKQNQCWFVYNCYIYFNVITSKYDTWINQLYLNVYLFKRPFHQGLFWSR